MIYRIIKRLRSPVLASVLLAAALACSGDSSAPRLGQPDVTGGELTNRFITFLAQKDVEGLRGFLSEGFMVQRADGTFATKDDYLSNLPQIARFSISNVSARQVDGALVVHWLLSAEEVINGQTYASTPAPRLSTFVWADGAWRLLSHANFNAPVSATPTAPR